MITAERKPLAEIISLVGDGEKVLVAGCDTCVAICLTGGEKEAEILASELRIDAAMNGRAEEIEHTSAIRQCEWEYLDAVAEQINAADVLAWAAGSGCRPSPSTSPPSSCAPREHKLPRSAGGARGLGGALRRLWQLHAGRDGGHLPHRPLRQEPPEWALWWLHGGEMRGESPRRIWIAPGSSSTTG